MITTQSINFEISFQYTKFMLLKLSKSKFVTHGHKPSGMGLGVMARMSGIMSLKKKRNV